MLGSLSLPGMELVRLTYSCNAVNEVANSIKGLPAVKR